MTNSDQRKAYLLALESGTDLLKSLISEDLSPEDFLSQYGNFFYEYAFHGDEAADAQKRVIEENSALCRLHEEVQRLAYSVYSSDRTVPKYEMAGMRRPGAAAEEITRIAKAANIDLLLGALRKQLEEVGGDRASPP